MGAASTTGRKRFAPKTSSGTRERTPQSRRRTSRISEGQETYEGELVAASGMGQNEPSPPRGGAAGPPSIADSGQARNRPKSGGTFPGRPICENVLYHPCALPRL